jgi:DNA polymerase (family X)
VLTRLSLGRAHSLASSIAQHVQRAGLPVVALFPLGSLRRFAPEIGDVALLAVAPPDKHGDVLDGLSRLAPATSVLRRTETSIALSSEKGPLAVHLTTPADAGAALLWHTGSRPHTSALRDRARLRGYEFGNGRLHRGGQHIETPSEDVVYERLELPYIPPELRESSTDLEAVERNGLPQLVAMPHIRGDLHAHTSWSDGRDTTQRMVQAARELGYSYFAITDHSERAWASRTLAVADVPHQRAEIETVRAQMPGIDILHGVEVDILHDGTLDFPDEVLAGFDIVLASLHDDGGHDGPRLTERYLRAMRHPLVNVITHPANRTPGARPGYDLDYDRLFAAAAETGTAMEVDGAPGHLDMDGAVARQAAAKGVTIVIDSDCHRAEALGRQMEFGVGTARRGWIEPRHVLNTRSAAEVRAFVARKRARR